MVIIEGAEEAVRQQAHGRAGSPTPYPRHDLERRLVEGHNKALEDGAVAPMDQTGIQDLVSKL